MLAVPSSSNGVVSLTERIWVRCGSFKGWLLGETGTEPGPLCVVVATLSPCEMLETADAKLCLGVARTFFPPSPSPFTSSLVSEYRGRGVGGFGAGADLGFFPPLPLPPFSLTFTIAKGAGIKLSLFPDLSLNNGGISISSSSSTLAPKFPALRVFELNKGGGIKQGERGEFVSAGLGEGGVGMLIGRRREVVVSVSEDEVMA